MSASSIREESRRVKLFWGTSAHAAVVADLATVASAPTFSRGSHPFADPARRAALRARRRARRGEGGRLCR